MPAEGWYMPGSTIIYVSTCYLDFLVLQSFSDMAQHSGTSCVPKKLSMVRKPHYKARDCCLATVMEAHMEDWEQLHSNANV